MRPHENCSCSRRGFLKGSGLSLAGVGLSTMLPAAVIDYVLANESLTGKRLLFLYMGGGCDVINTVIPHGDADYNTTTRPSLYIPPQGQPNGAINLNGFASFHPSLAKLMDSFNAGDLAVIHRVGYPTMSLSHFDGYKIWNGGDPGNKQILDGWLYRYVQQNAIASGAALPIVTVNGATPALLTGSERYVNIANVDSFDYIHAQPARSKFRDYWRELYAGTQGLESFRPVLSQTGVKLVDVVEQYKLWDQLNWNPKDPNTGQYLFPVDSATDSAGFGFGAYGFFKNLRVCALSLLESDGRGNGTRLSGMEMNGFDTHDGQGTVTTGAHPELLRWIAWGLNSLRIVFNAAEVYDPGHARSYTPIWDDVAIVTYSEFGRTSRENGSLGTDHGQATFSLVAGGSVNGGVYNCDGASWAPGSMFSVDGQYLAHVTDFRAIFWELLRDHMGANPVARDTIFPGYGAAGLTELNLFAP
jgi:uncharacterized protein (DUF1501 family)